MDKPREVILKVEGLSKSYYIKSSEGTVSPFLALNNISFTLYRGDVMGIIGSNGSGKSTLLKILSEVIKPTGGKATFYGTATSILDVGDNFHPDLTGRENVNIQLKISGAAPDSFSEAHDKIQAFSEIATFYDQPIKSYSAGMFLRLAFSVAIHLSSDMLILDEVLSVGDEGFQLKCRDLLAQMAQAGKTILFVSHSRAQVQELANRCLWLHQGEIHKIGKPVEVLGEYFLMHKDNHDAQKKIVAIENSLENTAGRIGYDWPDNQAPGNESMSLLHLSVSDGAGGQPNSAAPIHIRMVVDKKRKGVHIGPFFFLQDCYFQPVMVGYLLNNPQGILLDEQMKDAYGKYEVTCIIPSHFLIPGKYFLLLRFGIEEKGWHNESQEAFRFSENLGFYVHEEKNYKDYIGDLSKGAVRPMLDWSIKPV